MTKPWPRNELALQVEAVAGEAVIVAALGFQRHASPRPRQRLRPGAGAATTRVGGQRVAAPRWHARGRAGLDRATSARSNATPRRMAASNSASRDQRGGRST